MATTANSKPARPAVIRQVQTAPATSNLELLRLVPAAIFSAVINVGLIGLLFLVPTPSTAKDPTEKDFADKSTVKSDDSKTEEEQPPLQTEDVDENAKDADVEINYTTDRKAEASVPGEMRPDDPIGVESARDNPIVSIAPPPGIGRGSGGALSAEGSGPPIGEGRGGGYGSLGKPGPGSFYGRSGATKENLLRDGGGTTASEAAVAKGLDWIVRHQAHDGHWSIDGFHQTARCTCENRGSHNNDIAGTAFGLLPLLGAGYTHKADKKNPNQYQKNVLAALNYLIRKQNKRTGDFGGGMYSHGLASIAMCEAYALTQDPLLKRSAQAAIKYIVYAQHSEGGWRYGPKQQGDTSVVGWQVMALKSAQMANLDVPARVMKKAQDYLDNCMSDQDYGYGYFGKGSTPTMSAVGLLCRQYIQGWGPSSPRMSKPVKTWLMNNTPKSGKNMYFYYYATQVLHHFGGESWDKWNVAMRDTLIKEQDQGLTPRRPHQKGSWSPVGDPFGEVGGRLMITSLSILTLEVYYRHLPLYGRDLGTMKDNSK